MKVTLEYSSDLHDVLAPFNFYSFYIEGISRACLQELARHRVASLSVKSTRYTLKELKNEKPFTYCYTDLERIEKYVVLTCVPMVDILITKSLDTLRELVSTSISNDVAKYLIPEAYKTNLMLTMDLDGLQNFIKLRTSKQALKEIRELAYSIQNILETTQ